MSMNTHQMAQAAQKGAANGNGAAAEKPKKRIESPSERATNMINNYMENIKRAVGKKIDPMEFANSVINGVARDPNLMLAMETNAASLMGATVQAAAVGLPVNTPLQYAFLLPYYAKDKVASAKAKTTVKKWQVNYQLGYRGVLKLVHNSGELAFVNAEVVYEKDYFDYMLGTERWIKHKPYIGPNPGKPIIYYAQFKLKDGEEQFKVWSYEKVLDHAIKYSKSYDHDTRSFFGPWQTAFDSMARKTVLLDVLNLAPKSTTMASLLAADNTTKTLPANGADEVNLLDMPNEDYEPTMIEKVGGESRSTEEGQIPLSTSTSSLLSIEGDPQATAENIRETYGLKRGSEIDGAAKGKAAKQAEMMLNPEDVI